MLGERNLNVYIRDITKLYLRGGLGPNPNTSMNAVMSIARCLNKIKAKLNFSEILLVH